MQKVKLSIRLDVQQLYDLDRLAEKRGVKLSEVVRAAISAFLNAQKKQDAEFKCPAFFCHSLPLTKAKIHLQGLEPWTP